MTEFISWGTLATYGGALAMVMVLTQFTKDIGILDSIPTRIWSYILACFVLLCATAFTTGLNVNAVFQIVFNAAIISLAANGGYDTISKR